MKRFKTTLLLCLSCCLFVSSAALSKEGHHWARINSDGTFSKEENIDTIAELKRMAARSEIRVARDDNTTFVGTPPTSTTGPGTSISTTGPATGTPGTGARFSIATVQGNGCSANPATIQGNTVFLSGARAYAGSQMTCTVVIHIENGETLKDLTFIHNIEMLLARKVQHWCYLNWERTHCVSPQWPYPQCDNCIYTRMGNQYYVAGYDVSYSGCGIDETQPRLTYAPQGDPQASWRFATPVRKSFKPGCASSDDFSVTFSGTVNEAGDSLGGGWNYEGTSYIAQNTMSLSKAPPAGSSASSVVLGVLPWVAVVGTVLAFAL